VRNVVTDMMTSVLTAKATPDAAIKAAGDKANAIFKDNQ